MRILAGFLSLCLIQSTCGDVGTPTASDSPTPGGHGTPTMPGGEPATYDSLESGWILDGVTTTATSTNCAQLTYFLATVSVAEPASTCSVNFGAGPVSGDVGYTLVDGSATLGATEAVVQCQVTEADGTVVQWVSQSGTANLSADNDAFTTATWGQALMEEAGSGALSWGAGRVVCPF